MPCWENEKSCSFITLETSFRAYLVPWIHYSPVSVQFAQKQGCFIQKILQAFCLLLRCLYCIIMRHDCDRYAMKREVAVHPGGEFPWSMSDFKPGDNNY